MNARLRETSVKQAYPERVSKKHRLADASVDVRPNKSDDTPGNAVNVLVKGDSTSRAKSWLLRPSSSAPTTATPYTAEPGTTESAELLLARFRHIADDEFAKWERVGEG